MIKLILEIPRNFEKSREKYVDFIDNNEEFEGTSRKEKHREFLFY